MKIDVMWVELPRGTSEDIGLAEPSALTTAVGLATDLNLGLIERFKSLSEAIAKFGRL